MTQDEILVEYILEITKAPLEKRVEKEEGVWRKLSALWLSASNGS